VTLGHSLGCIPITLAIHSLQDQTPVPLKHPPQSCNHHFIFSLNLAKFTEGLLSTSHEWNHTVFVLWWLADFKAPPMLQHVTFLFQGWVVSTVWIDPILLIHFPFSRHLGCFHLLVTVLWSKDSSLHWFLSPPLGSYFSEESFSEHGLGVQSPDLKAIHDLGRPLCQTLDTQTVHPSYPRKMRSIRATMSSFAQEHLSSHLWPQCTYLLFQGSHLLFQGNGYWQCLRSQKDLGLN
jgi:hypothetical protein